MIKYAYTGIEQYNSVDGKRIYYIMYLQPYRKIQSPRPIRQASRASTWLEQRLKRLGKIPEDARLFQEPRYDGQIPGPDGPEKYSLIFVADI